MKILLLTFYFVFALNFMINAQKVEVVIEESDEINEFASYIRNVELFHDFSDCCIGIKLIECGNLIGTFPGEHGKELLLYDLYISVKQLDEESGKSTIGYFWVRGKYHNPRNYQFEAKEKRLIFEHGTEKEPIKISLILSSEGIKIE